MLLKIVLGLIAPLLLLFFILAWIYKKIGIYVTGMLVTNLYLLIISEGLVYTFNRKIGLGIIGLDQLIKMFINPYKGSYKIFMLNFYHNKVLLISVWAISCLLLLIIKKRVKICQQLNNPSNN